MCMFGARARVRARVRVTPRVRLKARSTELFRATSINTDHYTAYKNTPIDETAPPLVCTCPWRV